MKSTIIRKARYPFSLSNLVEATNQQSCLLVSDENFRVIYYNPPTVKLAREGSLDARQMKMFLIENLIPTDLRKIANALTKGNQWKGKIELKLKNNRCNYWEISVGKISSKFTEKKRNLLWLIRDFSDQKDVSKKLLQRVEFEMLLNSISSQFINLPTTEFDQEFRWALMWLCKYFQVERGYLYLQNRERTQYEQTYDYCVKSVENK